jgi:hypothetical protein
MNGLSDHNTQLITLKTISLKTNTKHFKEIRTFDENSINDFLNKLSYEIWDTIFSSEDVNTTFNTLLDTYLKMFYSSSPCPPTKKYNLPLKGMIGLPYG